MARSPLYNPEDPDESQEASSNLKSETCEESLKELVETLASKEETYPPRPGSYHMYHRIDGELVAVGVIELTSSYFNSGYFIYKSKYSYLNLGVVGAIIELEYCRKLQEWLPDL